MKTIKIIDLLNKIAKGEEVSKKIIYDNEIYEYNVEVKDEDEILEHLTEGEGRSFLGRSMYDAIFDKIHALITENEQLKNDKTKLQNNWNELKKTLERRINSYEERKKLGKGYELTEVMEISLACDKRFLKEMQELEQGKDE